MHKTNRDGNDMVYMAVPSSEYPINTAEKRKRDTGLIDVAAKCAFLLTRLWTQGQSVGLKVTA
jgi:hypothetical protein